MTASGSPDLSDYSATSLVHEILALKELFNSRFAAQDKAVALLQARADKMPSIDVVDSNLTALGRVMAEKFTTMAEKFSTIQIQFTDRDLALIAALAAAEKAVAVQNNNNLLANNKQEGNFTKLIDGIGERLVAQAKSSDDKIDGLRERMNSVEGKTSNVDAKASGIDKTWGIFAVAAALIISVAGVVIANERSATIPLQPPQVIYIPQAGATAPPPTVIR